MVEVLVVESVVVEAVVVESVVVDAVVVESVVVELVVVESVVVVLVDSRQTVGSGSSPSNSSLWLSAFPIKEEKTILPLIWLKVVLASAKGASTEP